MRITNGSMVRNYTNGLNSNLSRLADLLDKASGSMRSFKSFSEDTASAVRAMNVRSNLAKLETHFDNAKAAKSKYEAAEDQLKLTQDIYQSFLEKFEGAMDATSQSVREDYIVELTGLRDRMLTAMNAQFNSQYLFCGTNTGERPWDFSGGVLYYYGTDVTTITSNTDGKAYLDTGLGLALDSFQQVIPGTATEISFSGLDIFGWGDDNVLLQMDKMIDMISQPGFNAEVAGPEFEKLKDLYQSISNAVTKIGTDSNQLDHTIDRLTTEKVNLQTRQKAIEAVDPEQAIMEWKLQEYAYNAALQMGSLILQPSIFSYLN